MFEISWFTFSFKARERVVSVLAKQPFMELGAGWSESRVCERVWGQREKWPGMERKVIVSYLLYESVGVNKKSFTSKTWISHWTINQSMKSQFYFKKYLFYFLISTFEKWKKFKKMIHNLFLNNFLSWIDNLRVNYGSYIWEMFRVRTMCSSLEKGVHSGSLVSFL